MADYKHVIRAAMDNAAEVLELEGVGTARHYFGEKQRAAHGDAPRYVWVPTDMRDRNPTSMQPVGGPRPLFASSVSAEIDCWGVDEDQAWALQNNVLTALYRVYQADLRFESAAHIRPGGAANQRGELIRLEISINAPVSIDAFVDLTTMQTPEDPWFVPARVEGEIYRSPNTEEDGELGLTVTS